MDGNIGPALVEPSLLSVETLALGIGIFTIGVIVGIALTNNKHGTEKALRGGCNPATCPGICLLGKCISLPF